MESSKLKKHTVITSLVMIASWVVPLFASQETILTSSAISVDYPAQLMNIATKDNSKVLTENGTGDNATLSVKALGNDLSPSWRFDRVDTDSKGTFFKLVNAESGRMLTPSGYKIPVFYGLVKSKYYKFGYFKVFALLMQGHCFYCLTACR